MAKPMRCFQEALNVDHGIAGPPGASPPPPHGKLDGVRECCLRRTNPLPLTGYVFVRPEPLRVRAHKGLR